MSAKIRQAVACCLSTTVLARALASFSPFPPESEHKCYFLDGTFDSTGGPCYSNVGASMCCYSGESCLEDSGLCLADPNGTPGQYDNGSSIWRRSCTDIAWQDAACLAVAWGRKLNREPCFIQCLSRSMADMDMRVQIIPPNLNS